MIIFPEEDIPGSDKAPSPELEDESKKGKKDKQKEKERKEKEKREKKEREKKEKELKDKEKKDKKENKKGRKKKGKDGDVESKDGEGDTLSQSSLNTSKKKSFFGSLFGGKGIRLLLGTTACSMLAPPTSKWAVSSEKVPNVLSRCHARPSFLWLVWHRHFRFGGGGLFSYDNDSGH